MDKNCFSTSPKLTWLNWKQQSFSFIIKYFIPKYDGLLFHFW
jgi:hypothetical protein